MGGLAVKGLDRYARFGPWAGLLGAVVLTVASALAAFAYTGDDGEAYSPLNHFVSELGEVGVSELATVFNIGLVISGLCFALFMATLSAGRQSRLVLGASIVGVVAGVAGAFVGVFPMNNLNLHGVATVTFFLAVPIAIALASAYIWRRRPAEFPRWLAVLGAVAVVSAALFALLLLPLIGEAGLIAPLERPDFIYLAALEWLAIAAIVVWTAAASLTWLAAARQGGGDRA